MNTNSTLREYLVSPEGQTHHPTLISTLDDWSPAYEDYTDPVAVLRYVHTRWGADLRLDEAEHMHEGLYLMVEEAEHPETPPVILSQLALSPEELTRELVADNPSTPAETLRLLSTDFSSNVRAVVAGNRSAPPSLLETLTFDDSPWVRVNLASNPSAPAKVLTNLTDDEPLIRELARRTLDAIRGRARKQALEA